MGSSSYQLFIDRKSAKSAETQTHHYVILLDTAAEEDIKRLALRHLAEEYPEDQLVIQFCRQMRAPCGFCKPFQRRPA